MFSMSLVEQILAGLILTALGGLVGWVSKQWQLGRRALSEQAKRRAAGADRHQPKPLIDEGRCADCHAEWEAKLAAGDERMDVSAEVDSFVVFWLPVMCKALKVNAPDCQAMEAQAKELLSKIISAGRAPRGQIGGKHA